MEGRLSRREKARIARARRSLVVLAAAAGAFAAVPSTASAEEETFKFRIPITVSGYEVKQRTVQGPRPLIDGHITHMKTDIVDAQGADVNQYPNSTPVPIDRLMLHHIVFLTVNPTSWRLDQTCDNILMFDNLPPPQPAMERFFAAGEERAQLTLPDGYGYEMGPAAQNHWGVLYMVMNHRAETDTAFIEYEVTVEKDPAEMTSVKPVWLDVENCKADPIYNVPGVGEPEETSVRTRDFTLDPDPAKFGATGGRIVAGAGHVHGGAYRLELRQPSCDDRLLAESTPTWGRKDHPFYNVRPILHEPGPVNMTAFKSVDGFPIRTDQPLRLNAIYDNSRPHTRVMGIMILFVAPDDTVPEDPCPDELQPDDVSYSEPPDGRVKGPPKFEVPLTGLDENDQAVTITKPPGKTRDVRSGETIQVRDNFFQRNRQNVKIDKGDTLNWAFDSSDVHNLTLANGPEAIGSPNLSRDHSGEPRVFKKRFKHPGTYRMFCALHPVQMSERVIVKP